MKHEIEIKVKPPGPKAREVIKRDEAILSPSVTRPYPLVIAQGEGCWVEDVDGNRFLDFSSGIAVCSTGHSHPKVVDAIKNQAEKFLHMSATDFYYDIQVKLAKKLCEITPGEHQKRVFFTNSGAEAIEASLKLARYATKRQQFIAFFGAFHGRTFGALALTASKAVQRKHFSPFMSGVTHIPYAYCYRCPYGQNEKTCNAECVDILEKIHFKRSVSPDEVAGIVVEPMQGEGGYVIPPKKFHERLKEMAEKHGILYIVDEIQTGMGRTGKMFSIEHYGIVPDIVAMAKGIASGLPLGAMVAKAELWQWPPGAHASTFGGNPVSCASALQTIDLLENELVENARVVGDYILKKLHNLAEKFSFIGDIRAKGLFIGVELVRDRKTKEMAKEEQEDIIHKAFDRGLLLLQCGESGIRLIPPLCVTKEEADIALGVLEECFGEVIKNK